MTDIEKDFIHEQWKQYETKKFRTHIKNTLLPNSILNDDHSYTAALLDYLTVPTDSMTLTERLTYYELFIKETIL